MISLICATVLSVYVVTSQSKDLKVASIDRTSTYKKYRNHLNLPSHRYLCAIPGVQFQSGGKVFLVEYENPLQTRQIVGHTIPDKQSVKHRPHIIFYQSSPTKHGEWLARYYHC